MGSEGRPGRRGEASADRAAGAASYYVTRGPNTGVGGSGGAGADPDGERGLGYQDPNPHVMANGGGGGGAAGLIRIRCRETCSLEGLVSPMVD
ncbi:MAG: hypothetical protein JXR96_01360 [Deltaproteobacteria bacterium]|nr:hypothetical protein [Deltaproteobacteria bacterium]